jgi:hypothetical protein
MASASVKRVLQKLEPVDARPSKLLEIFALKNKISAMVDPVYILLTDDVTGEQMSIYDQAEIGRLRREDPHGFVEVLQIGIRFDLTDELAAVQGVLRAARGDSRDYQVFVKQSCVN